MPEKKSEIFQQICVINTIVHLEGKSRSIVKKIIYARSEHKRFFFLLALPNNMSFHYYTAHNNIYVRINILPNRWFTNIEVLYTFVLIFQIK